ncbi:hypothetical protein Dda_9066 [Drechslerella dactyloides]|uniref:Uncharacterized protein n=1 Tax=Drechslerella dactyloides TaxID=74499 RepID=A0AAD6ISN0_DREDA|nr:hypothetical protein Dda_9066 [Drechslerella dactyloides]
MLSITGKDREACLKPDKPTHAGQDDADSVTTDIDDDPEEEEEALQDDPMGKAGRGFLNRRARHHPRIPATPRKKR